MALVPIRSGSKRIPRKNMTLVDGKPLTWYTLEAARQSGCFDPSDIFLLSDEDPVCLARHEIRQHKAYISAHVLWLLRTAGGAALCREPAVLPAARAPARHGRRRFAAAAGAGAGRAHHHPGAVVVVIATVRAPTRPLI